MDPWCSLKDLMGAIDNRDGWRESQRDLCRQRDLVMIDYLMPKSDSFVNVWSQSLLYFQCFYNLEYSVHWPHIYRYTHKVSADMFIGLHLVFYIELGSPQRISKWTLLRVDHSSSVKHDQVQVKLKKEF